MKSFAQLTPFEKSDGLESASYAETIKWFEQLDKSSKKISMKKMGLTDEGIPLHLVLVDKSADFDPASWHKKKKVVILINNGIHPGEPDGMDASMMLIRDIINKKIDLPDNVAIGLIPVYNIGGALNRNSSTRVNQNGPKQYGFRGNSQNLDLNRDFTKCDSREARSFAEIFHLLDPDIFIDNHVSDGADFQHTMTLITTQYDKLGVLGDYLKNKFEPAVYQDMSDKGWDMIPYMSFDKLDLNTGMEMFMDHPRYSTGYAALFNTMGFMPETHMLKPFKERVRSTYDLMVSFIKIAGQNAEEIIKERKRAKSIAKSRTNFPLKWKIDTTVSREIQFKGYEQKYALSQATGLQKMYYDKSLPYTKPLTFYNSFRQVADFKKPSAYIIPRGWHEVIDLLKLNKVKMSELKKDTMMSVTAYRIESYKSYPVPVEKHHKNYAVVTKAYPVGKHFRKGDMIIYMNQESNKYIIEMLEPEAEDGFFAWNFFDGILQQKEGYSEYRWDELAADALKTSQVLKDKFEQRKKSDPVFAKDHSAMLEFIYKNSRYYEAAHMVYPVYRVE